jgi:xanthine dehydrogenase YagS FAD-binding subunit
MNKFAYVNVASTDEALPLLHAEARPLAGGTDIIPLMKEGLATPTTLIDIKGAGQLDFIREETDGLHIGALTTLDALDRSEIVRARYTALAEAAAQAASPQLRSRATLGGNLLQQVRCWYYRGDFHCWMKGGQECQARDGENQYHAIMEQSPCVAVHPSDPPAALIAFGATVRLAGPQGERNVPLVDFLRPPEGPRRQLHTLGYNELITEIVVPAHQGRSVYLKAMDRAVWAYALGSVAAVARVEGGRLNDLRIVLGAVANVPVRATSAEALAEGKPFDADLARRAGEAAVADARPLENNGYKVPLIRNLVAQALHDLAAT